MSKKQLKEAFESFGEIPDNCRKQLELQKDTYFALVDKMERYEWRDLFTTGVKIDEKDGDPQVFMSRLLVPIKLQVFIPMVDDTSSSKFTVKTRVLPALLEEKLKALDLYMGPIGQKVYTSTGEELQNPFRIAVDKTERVARIICV